MAAHLVLAQAIGVRIPVPQHINFTLKMTMFIKLYLIALPVFIALDAVWLGLIARGIYSKYLGHLLKTNVDYLAAALFYLMFIAGIVIFVLIPNIEKDSWVRVLALGAFFGLVTYATYDLTNLATIKDWPVVVSVIDLVWGASVASFVSVITYFIARATGH